MTASLVDVSVVLVWIGCIVGRPSRASLGKDDDGGECIGYIIDGGWGPSRAE